MLRLHLHGQAHIERLIRIMHIGNSSEKNAIIAAFLPLARHIAKSARSSPATLVVGLCGPQGSGKSTLATILREQLQAEQLSIAVLSLDDLYLTKAQRVALARSVHPLLRTRGVPGTHDVELGLRTLDALSATGTVALPAFDKAIDDRLVREAWPCVRAPVKVVIFEGWCVGAAPQDPDSLRAPINDLEREHDRDARWRRYVNDALANTYAPLFARIGMLILLKPPSFDVVHRWRAEQEHALRAQLIRECRDTSALMSDDDLRRFIAHYERLTRHILIEMPMRANLTVTLDEHREVVDIEGSD